MPLNAVEREPVPTRVIDPNTSEVSYKPKQRSFRNTRLFFRRDFYLEPTYVLRLSVNWSIIHKDMAVKQMPMFQLVLGRWRNGPSLAGTYTYMWSAITEKIKFLLRIANSIQFESKIDFSLHMNFWELYWETKYFLYIFLIFQRVGDCFTLWSVKYFSWNILN